MVPKARPTVTLCLSSKPFNSKPDLLARWANIQLLIFSEKQIYRAHETIYSNKKTIIIINNIKQKQIHLLIRKQFVLETTDILLIFKNLNFKMGQSIHEWTKYILWKTAFKNYLVHSWILWPKYQYFFKILLDFLWWKEIVHFRWIYDFWDFLTQRTLNYFLDAEL